MLRHRSGKYSGRCSGAADPGHCQPDETGCCIHYLQGIIDDKEQTVVDAVKAAGLEILEVTYQGEWVSVTARKQA